MNGFWAYLWHIFPRLSTLFAHSDGVVIRTNSFATTLTINAPLDTIHHYDNAGSVDIIAVANKSYHENGNVAFLEIAKGRVSLESESKVKQVHVSTKVTNVAEDGTKTKEVNTFDQVIVALVSDVEVPDFSRDEVALNSIGSDGKLVVEIEKENNQSDYVYLYQQGLVEQIRVASGDSTNSGTSVQPAPITDESKKGNDDSLSNNTSSIALDIANNLKAGSTATPEQIDAGTVDITEIIDSGLSEEVKDSTKDAAISDAQVDEYNSDKTRTIPVNAVVYNLRTDTYYCQDDNYLSDKDALVASIEGAQSKDTILLMKDISLEYNRLPISKSLTINGNNHNVEFTGDRGFAVGQNATSKVDVTFKDVTVTNKVNGGRCVETRGNINSLTLDNVTLKTLGTSGYLQPLTIGGNQSTSASIVIKNSVIQTSDDGRYGYAITTFNPVNMSISDSTIKGWACLNLKGPDSSAGSSGSSFSIDNTNLVSKNIYPGYSNAYAIIKMETAGINVNFILRGCTFDIDGANNTQYIVSFRDSEQKPVSGCVVAIGPGNTINLKGDAKFDNGTGNGSVLYITGGTFNVNPTGHLVDGYVAHDNGDGTWTVVPANYKVDYLQNITLGFVDENSANEIKGELESEGYLASISQGTCYAIYWSADPSAAEPEWNLFFATDSEQESISALDYFVSTYGNDYGAHVEEIQDGYILSYSEEKVEYFDTLIEANAFADENSGTVTDLR